MSISPKERCSILTQVTASFMETKRTEYKSTKRIIHAVFLTIKRPLIYGGIWEFVFALGRLSLPLALYQLLKIIEKDAESSHLHEGLPFAIALSLGIVLSAVAQNRTAFLSASSGIRLRAALSACIYEHALRLSPSGRAGLSSGTVTNLVAVDTQKLFDVCVELHSIWSCPLLIVAVVLLLQLVVEAPEMILGIAALLLSLPIVKLLVQKMLKIRKARSTLTDTRISVLTSILHGIRFTKLNHYESLAEAKVNKIRESEISLLRKELWMWGWVLSLAVSVPVLATAAAFAFYTLVDEENILKPSTTFSALLFFSILRFPINIAARLVGKLAQANEGLNRIANFLDRETSERGEVPFSYPLPDEPVLSLKDETFIVSSGSQMTVDNVYTSKRSPSPCEHATDKGFVIRKLSLTLQRSEVVAVVGKVGAGKSSLLRAILGELPSSTGSRIAIHGRVSYSAQQAFILNTTLRENILFGQKFHSAKYKAALSACCLKQDLERLGPSGDLTEIGERGVTLSGGQKQRVALARSVYAHPDLCLLDDPFSALDTDTGMMVFDQLFVKGRTDKFAGLRRSGTLLVTHAIHILPHVDKILVMEEGEPTFIGSWKELEEHGGNGSLVERMGECSDDTSHTRSDQESFNPSRDTPPRTFGQTMTVEEREYGVSSLKVWTSWFRHAGGWSFFFIQSLLLVLDRGLFVAGDWWLSIWSDSAYIGVDVFGISFAPQNEGLNAQLDFIVVYLVILILSMVATAVRSQWAGEVTVNDIEVQSIIPMSNEI